MGLLVGQKVFKTYYPTIILGLGLHQQEDKQCGRGFIRDSDFKI